MPTILSLWIQRVAVYRCTVTNKPKKTPEDTLVSPTLKHPKHEREGRIVVYRSYFQRLLSTPKPLRDQLCLELPCLEGLRTGEISTLRAEWFDVSNGDLKVLDSKKNEMFTLPLDPTVAKHFIQMNVTEGFLIQGRKRTGRGLTPCHIERIWKDWSWTSNIPVLHPRLGRAYLATFEHFVLGKPTSYIQWLLRHDSLQSTEHYLSRIVSYEDMKSLFYMGKTRMFQTQTKEESIQ